MTILQTPARLAAFKQMVASNHPWYQKLLSSVGTTYGDYGQIPCALYGWTGDSKWAAPFWLALLKTQWVDRLNQGLFPDQNTLREYGLTLLVFYDWMRSALSDVQKQTLRDLIWTWCETALGINLPPGTAGGFRLGDTDQTLSQHFFLIGAELLLGPEDIRFKDLRSRFTIIGNLAPSANPALRTNARDAVADYVHRARGGTWIVSTEYNTGDMALLFMGREIVNTLAGGENYPEIAAWAQSAAIGVIMETTPDFRTISRWGDDQHQTLTEAAVIQQREVFCATCASVIAGTKESAYLWKYLDILQTFPPYGRTPLPRFYFYCDPYALRTDWRQELSLAYSSPGVGLVRVYSGWTPQDSMAHLQYPPINQVDHEHAFPAVDFRVWRDGEWVIDHPIGYNLNRGQIENVSSSFEEPGMVARILLAQHAEDSFGYIWSKTSGPVFFSAWLNPITWVKDLSRCVVYKRLDDGNDLILALDHFDLAGDPRTLDKNFNLYPLIDRNQINASGNLAAIRIHCPYAPNLTQDGDDWKLDYPLLNSQVSGTVYTPLGATAEVVNEKEVWTNYQYNMAPSEMKFHILIAPKLPAGPFYCFTALIAHPSGIVPTPVTWDAATLKATIGNQVIQFDPVNHIVNAGATAPSG